MLRPALIIVWSLTALYAGGRHLRQSRVALESMEKKAMVNVTLSGLPLRLTWHPAQLAAYLTAAFV